MVNVTIIKVYNIFLVKLLDTILFTDQENKAHIIGFPQSFSNAFFQYFDDVEKRKPNTKFEASQEILMISTT